MAESLVLRSGFAPWLRNAPAPLALAAGIALATAGARPGWTAAAFIGLLVTLCYAWLRSDPPACRGRLHLADDGTGLLFTAAGSQAVRQIGGGWTSRWLCVLPLRDDEAHKRFRCVVCASLNPAGRYPRLLRRQRTGAWRPDREDAA